MSSTALRCDRANSGSTPLLAAVATPIKQPGSVLDRGGDQREGCPNGSPIAGLCTAAHGVTTAMEQQPPSTARKQHLLPWSAAASSAADSPQQSYPSAGRQAQAQACASRVSSSPKESRLSAAQPSHDATRQHSPTSPPQPQQHQARQMRLSSDNRPRRDQDICHSSPGLALSSSTPAALQDGAGASGAGQPMEQPLLPVDILLSPLLPSADESRLVDRLSQLRYALDQHMRLAAGWEQQVGGQDAVMQCSTEHASPCLLYSSCDHYAPCRVQPGQQPFFVAVYHSSQLSNNELVAGSFVCMVLPPGLPWLIPSASSSASDVAYPCAPCRR